MLDFSDRTRTGISKLISRCALSGPLSDNRDALVEVNKIIKELEQEANDLAETIGLDKDVILAAARADSDNNGSDMTSRANIPSFSAEDNANARVWFDNLLATLHASRRQLN